MLAGFTCQTITAEDTKKQVDQAVQEKLATLKATVRDEMARVQQFKEEALRQDYSEKSFLDFSLKYPSRWTISHEENKVLFTSSDKVMRLSISKEKIGAPEGAELVTSTTWGEFMVKTYTVTGTPNYKIMDIYPGTFKNSRSLGRIQVDQKYFDEIVASLKDFSF